jgi:hypothetical protein
MMMARSEGSQFIALQHNATNLDAQTAGLRTRTLVSILSVPSPKTLPTRAERPEVSDREPILSERLDHSPGQAPRQGCGWHPTVTNPGGRFTLQSH